MATYHLFNVQLLPLDSSTTHEVGEIGYKKLFDLLAMAVSEAKKSRSLISLAYQSAHDTFLAPDYSTSMRDYAYGSFAKFHRADAVADLETRSFLFRAPEGITGVSNLHGLPFVFDYKTHRLAVRQLNGRLPSSRTFVKALAHFLSDLAATHFPDYTLTINVVAEKTVLDEALKDVRGFKKVEIQLAFPNGSAMTKQLKQLRDNNIHSLRTEVSAAKGAQIPKLPDWVFGLLQSARVYGSIAMSYVSKKTNRRRRYHSEEHPATFRVDQRKAEPDNVYRERVKAEIRKVAES